MEKKERLLKEIVEYFKNFVYLSAGNFKRLDEFIELHHRSDYDEDSYLALKLFYIECMKNLGHGKRAKTLFQDCDFNDQELFRQVVHSFYQVLEKKTMKKVEDFLRGQGCVDSFESMRELLSVNLLNDGEEFSKHDSSVTFLYHGFSFLFLRNKLVKIEAFISDDDNVFVENEVAEAEDGDNEKNSVTVSGPVGPTTFSYNEIIESPFNFMRGYYGNYQKISLTILHQGYIKNLLKIITLNDCLPKSNIDLMFLKMHITYYMSKLDKSEIDETYFNGDNFINFRPTAYVSDRTILESGVDRYSGCDWGGSYSSIYQDLSSSYEKFKEVDFDSVDRYLPVLLHPLTYLYREDRPKDKHSMNKSLENIYLTSLISDYTVNQSKSNSSEDFDAMQADLFLSEQSFRSLYRVVMDRGDGVPIEWKYEIERAGNGENK